MKGEEGRRGTGWRRERDEGVEVGGKDADEDKTFELARFPCLVYFFQARRKSLIVSRWTKLGSGPVKTELLLFSGNK